MLESHQNRACNKIRRALRCAFLVIFIMLWSSGVVYAQIFKLPHPDTTVGNFFGAAVSIDGNRALVGASAENVCGESSGAAYIFERDPELNVWVEVARLVPSDCSAGDFFGRTLSLSGDKALIAAAETFFNTGASNEAYIFERDSTTGTWQEVAKLSADGHYEEGAFATSVSLDGDRALVTTSGDLSGRNYAGAAYIFERQRSGTWKRVVRLTGKGSLEEGVFGGNGILEGDRIVVTASTYYRYKPGSVYIFERDAKGRWMEVEQIRGVDDFFISIDLNHDRLLIGESRGGHRKSGEVTLYARGPSGIWHKIQTIEPPFPYDYGAFGTKVALEGNRALIVGYDEQLGFSFNVDRVVYLFECTDDGEWRQNRIIDIGETAFGIAVDMNGEFALIGQASEKQPGAGYVIPLP